MFLGSVWVDFLFSLYSHVFGQQQLQRQKRECARIMLLSGSHRLGGDSSIMSDLSPIQAAAMAAERRLLDDIWCGSVKSTETLNARSRKRNNSWSNANSCPPYSSHQWGSDVIVLTEEASETRCTKRSCSPSDPGHGCSKDELNSVVVTSSLSSPTTSYNAIQSRDETTMWDCAECTLLNPWAAVGCNMRAMHCSKAKK